MRITFVLGTRPEVIKLAPLILEARRRGHRAKVIFTGQHATMALPLLRFFGCMPNLNLDVMCPDQTLTGLSSRMLSRMDEQAGRLKGDFLVVQGDTTSAFVAAYWGFCRGIPVAHVEAGLRTYQLRNPFPEEANRQLIGRLATLHFAPTVNARNALIGEKVDPASVFVTGNTAIDALLYTLARVSKQASRRADGTLDRSVSDWISDRPMILVTAHRRESFGGPLLGICRGIVGLLEKKPDACVVFPVHPNPNVRKMVYRRLGNHPRILLLPPQPYLAFVQLMNVASLILTDSGGIQEEAPSLRKPILVMRDTTERPEGVREGFARLVGTDADRIVKEGILAFQKRNLKRGRNPYGDGKASARILKIMEKSLRTRSRPT